MSIENNNQVIEEDTSQPEDIVVDEMKIKSLDNILIKKISKTIEKSDVAHKRIYDQLNPNNNTKPLSIKGLLSVSQVKTLKKSINGTKKDRTSPWCW
jgi:hypothetical protein